MLRTKRFAVGAVAIMAICLGCTAQNVQNGESAGADQANLGDTVKAKHILVMYDGSERAPARITRSKEEAAALIAEIEEKVKQGEKFEDLAMDYSDCPSATKGGDLGRFGRNQMTPAFEEATYACQVGGTTGIVETPFGYHIIYRYE